MFRPVEVDVAPSVDPCVDNRVVVRAYGNHRQQDRLNMEMDQGQIGSGVYIPRGCQLEHALWVLAAVD